MFATTDYDNLRQIMAESPEKKELLTRLLASIKWKSVPSVIPKPFNACIQYASNDRNSTS